MFSFCVLSCEICFDSHRRQQRALYVVTLLIVDPLNIISSITNIYRNIMNYIIITAIFNYNILNNLLHLLKFLLF